MPSLSTSHSRGCIRRRKLRRGAQKTRRDARTRAGGRAHNLQTEAVSQPWSPMSRRSSPACRRERAESPDPLARLTPTEPVKRHRGKSERRRRRRGNVGEHQRNGEAETEGIGGVGGCMEKTKNWEWGWRLGGCGWAGRGTRGERED